MYVLRCQNSFASSAVAIEPSPTLAESQRSLPKAAIAAYERKHKKATNVRRCAMFIRVRHFDTHCDVFPSKGSGVRARG